MSRPKTAAPGADAAAPRTLTEWSGQMLTVRGETRSLTEWAASLGITRQAMEWRLRTALEDAVGVGRRVSGPQPTSYRVNGETLTVKEWADRLGRPKFALMAEIKRATVRILTDRRNDEEAALSPERVRLLAAIDDAIAAGADDDDNPYAHPAASKARLVAHEAGLEWDFTSWADARTMVETLNFGL